MNPDLRAQCDRIQQRALWVGIAGLVLCVVGYFMNPDPFLRSYLVEYLFWLGIALGSMVILMLHHLVGGNWGFAIRRILEAAVRTLPLLAVLFVPILVGLPRLYVWAHWGAADTALPPFKRFYLSVPSFVVRAAFYFGAWLLLAHFLTKWSEEQDRDGNPAMIDRLQYLSAPGILIYGFTITYASIDWVMSLEPEFFSTIFGMIFMILPALGAMAFAVVVAALLGRQKPLSQVLTPGHFNDYGNLLLTFTMLWAYLAFSQFLIVWAGNLQDEIPWYVTRTEGAWAVVALLMVVFGFAVPFLLLLSRDVKRHTRRLGTLAVAILLMVWVALYWAVAPSFYPRRPEVHWTDLVAPLGIGGVWIAMFVWRLKAQPLVPQHDPRFGGVLVADVE